MERVRFGTAGVPVSTLNRNTISGVSRIKELGLGCMEVEFVRGVKMGDETAHELEGMAEKLDVTLSVHAPYYINLNSREREKVEASRQRILESARIGAIFGAHDVVFHPAFYHADALDTVYGRVKSHLLEIAHQLRENDIKIMLRPETTGKNSQFGSLTEVLELSAGIEGIMPCFDFAHLHARDGRLNSYQEFCEVLDAVEAHLGREGLDTMHIHVSGIEYGPKGEKNHLILQESDLDYSGLIQAWKDYTIQGTVISESPNLEGDALLLQDLYRTFDN